MPVDAKQVVRDYLQAVADEDYESLNLYLAPQFRTHTPPWGLRADRTGLIAAMQETAQMSPDGQHTIHAVVADGDLVAVHWTGSGTDTGPGGGLPPTGRKVTMSGIDLYRVRDGQIIESWSYDNALEVLRDHGVL